MATFADAKRNAVTPGMLVVMAGSTGDVAITGKDLVIKEKLTDFRFGGIDGMEIPRTQLLRPFGRKRADGDN